MRIEIRNKIELFLIRYSRLVCFLPFLFSVVAVLVPINLVLGVVAAICALLIWAVAQVFLNDSARYSHGDGIYLGVSATIAVTVGFGCVYGLILLAPNYNNNFAFNENTDSAQSIMRREARELLAANESALLRNFKLHEYWESKESNDAQSVKVIDEKVETWKERAVRKLAFNLSIKDAEIESWSNGLLGLHENGIQAEITKHIKYLSNSSIVFLMNTETNPNSDLVVTALSDTARKHSKYKVPMVTTSDELQTMDIIYSDYFAEEINEIIEDSINCYLGEKVELDEPCGYSETIPSGYFAIGVYSFSKSMLDDYGLREQGWMERSELVFSGILFSAMNVMTSGYSDMVPRNYLSRVLVILQFISYVVIILLIVPMGMGRSNS